MPDTPDNQPAKRRLRPAGGYRRLRSFQANTLIYDGTVSFCRKFASGYSRTQDQMVQAARSGRQNIAEGNRAAAVSSKSELKLTNAPCLQRKDPAIIAYEALEELDPTSSKGLFDWLKMKPAEIKSSAKRAEWKVTIAKRLRK